MKKRFILTVLFLSWGATALAETYLLETDKSTIQWKAQEVTGERFGTIKLEKGEVEFDQGKLQSGEFLIDMASIEVSNKMPSKLKKMLTEDLKSENFFSVKIFPLSKFALTQLKDVGMDQKEIMGNLTIKDVTLPITFPAKIREENGTLIAEAKITLDRTRWDIRYRSGKFFQDLGDKLINDEFDLQITLKAKKK